MGHHADDVATGVADARDVVDGAVGVGVGRTLAVGGDVAEDDAILVMQLGEAVGLDDVVALGVGDGQAEDLAVAGRRRAGGLGGFHAEVGPLATELGAVVEQHGAGEQAGFQQDLEAVADAEDRTPAGGVVAHGGHDRGAGGHGAGTQVIAVAESAGQYDQFDVVQRRVGVPGVASVHAGHVVEDVQRVGVAITAGENDDGGVHAG